ncbi:SDR family oxidoreductase [Pseudomonas sp. dw_358]|uniref:SDR family NAD(P)-dependent oxidoreductase n=1 Tax=Pseudomonas sp. dw_358 TaxID=2720083 RepID=UPI001BD2BBC2|nr:SDR family oxidoreductase [Pseudomonas sp. dw_358]
MTPSFSVAGKRVLITGASKGIGRSLALAFAAGGAQVLAAARDLDKLQTLKAEIAALGGLCSVFVLDVADRASREAAFAQIDALDVLINNAGVEKVTPSLGLDEATWDAIVDVNLKGAFFCAQAAAQRMSAGASIINMCSLTSEVGVPGALPYGASKTGLVGMTRGLAAEWAPLGIRVNGLGPGYFETDLTRPFYENPGWQEAMLAKVPMGRLGHLDDLAGAALFLASQASGYITGQVLYVDGGYLAGM